MTSDGDNADKPEEGGPLADQLADLDMEVDDESDGDERDQETDGDERDQETDGETASDGEKQSDEALFREAVDGLDEEQIREAKYEAPGGEASGESEDPDQEPSEETAEAHAESTVDGRLANQLSEMDVDSDELPERRRATETDDREEAPMPPEKSARETFEEAIDGMSPAEMRRHKYDLTNDDGDEASAERDGSENEDEATSSEQTDEEKRKERQRRQEERKFQQAMRDVERIEGDQKFRAPDAPDPSTYFDETKTSRTPADFTTPTLAKSGDGLHHVPPLDDTQKTMLERAEALDERGELRVLNLRGETADDAAEMLREFTERCRLEGVDFARIIPGRGKQSDGDPVLKPLVLRWLETRAIDIIRGYAPERGMTGDYGSLIVEFRRV